MRKDDTDFEAYLTARWSVIEEVLRRAGCPDELVTQTGVRGLSRSFGSWRRVRREDADVRVLGDVLREARSRLGVLPDMRDALADIARLRADQVDQVLDLQAGPRSCRPTVVASPPASGRPSVAMVAAESRALRARHFRVWVAVAGVAAIGVAVAVITGSGPSPTEPTVTGVARYVDGVLYGDGFVIEVPGVTQLLQLEVGVAYVDRRGGVHHVHEDGRVHLVGSSAPASGALGSSEGSRLVWVERNGRAGARVVVYAAAKEQVVGVLDLDAHPALRTTRPADVHLIALDETTLHFAIGDVDFRWRVGSDRTESDGSGLAAAADGVEARTRGDATEVRRPTIDEVQEIEGTGAVLSPDGAFVLTSVGAGDDGADPGRPLRVLLHDTATGERMPSGLGRDQLVSDAAFGPGPTITYVVVPMRDPAAGPHTEVDPLVVVRTCSLPRMECRDLPPVEPGTVGPLLAR